MNFDVIIGNPPYQEITSGGGTTKMAMPLYDKFIKRSIEFNPRYISMIIPSRWMSGGKSVLDEFRDIMIQDKHLREVINYSKSDSIFEGVGIAGGIQYFLWDSIYAGETKMINREVGKEDIASTRDLSKYTYGNSHNKEQYMIIVDNTSAMIADKVLKLSEATLDEHILPYRPFGLGSDFEGSLIESSESDIKVICSNGRETWTSLMGITQNREIIEKWKVCTGYKNPDRGGVNIKAGYNVINKPRILKPLEVCSMSYLVLDTFDTEEQAKNFTTYIKSKLARFLSLCTITSTALSSRNFMFVPIQDYNKSWTDTELYTKYSLTAEEIDYIETRIKEMV